MYNSYNNWGYGGSASSYPGVGNTTSNYGHPPYAAPRSYTQTPSTVGASYAYATGFNSNQTETTYGARGTTYPGASMPTYQPPTYESYPQLFPGYGAAGKKTRGSEFAGPQGRGTFPQKRPGVIHVRRQGPPKNVETIVCDVCKISCGGQVSYQDHLKGKLHKKRESLAKGTTHVSLPKTKPSFHCQICDIVCTGKDTYDSHIKGSKHQRTFALLQKTGKPIPSTTPTVIAPEGPVGDQSASVAAVLGVTQTGGVVVSGATSAHQSAVSKAIEAEAAVQPIGEEYVEPVTDPSGNVYTYNCRLCDCQFTDKNAIAIHTKGRRHRLAYKTKVDPSFKVELKNSVAKQAAKRVAIRQQQQQPHYHQQGYYAAALGGFAASAAPSYPAAPRPIGVATYQWRTHDNAAFSAEHESVEDRHIMEKYNSIKLLPTTYADIGEAYDVVEKTLIKVNDVLTPAHFDGIIDVTEDPGVVLPDQRIFRLFSKVGLFFFNILIKGDHVVDLVVACTKIPTEAFLTNNVNLFKHFSDPELKDKITVTEDIPNSLFSVQLADSPIIVNVYLTSPAVREYEQQASTTALPAGALPIKAGLHALALMRRNKWYESKAKPLKVWPIVISVLRDIQVFVSTWRPLTSWMLSLLSQQVIDSFGYAMTPGDALRRIFEAVSAGILISNRPLLLDPCEKDKCDVFEALTIQQREDITSSMQHALRLVVFDQIDKVLVMKRLDEPAVEEAQVEDDSRKRSYDEDEIAGDVKRQKPSEQEAQATA